MTKEELINEIKSALQKLNTDCIEVSDYSCKPFYISEGYYDGVRADYILSDGVITDYEGNSIKFEDMSENDLYELSLVVDEIRAEDDKTFKRTLN